MSYYYTKVAEKAMLYFEKAVELAPDEPRWRLLVAACLRRTGQFHKALSEYQDIHKKFPDNIECLKFLVRLCSDMGLKETQFYANELKKAEKAKELKERQGSGRPGTTGIYISCFFCIFSNSRINIHRKYYFQGSRKSNSDNSSRAGSGMSVLSDHRSSPIPGKKDNQGSNSGGVIRSTRTFKGDNSAELNFNGQTSKYYFNSNFLQLNLLQFYR